MIRPLRFWPEPILLTPTRPWDFGNCDLDHRELETDMFDTLQHHRALGLAANQIGLPLRVFVMHSQTNSEYRVFYNPEILNQDSETVDSGEGCLSFPKTILKISRPKFIQAQWQNSNGEICQGQFVDIDARCFCHELEHLNGQVFKDHVSDLKFRKAYKKS